MLLIYPNIWIEMLAIYKLLNISLQINTNDATEYYFSSTQFYFDNSEFNI